MRLPCLVIPIVALLSGVKSSLVALDSHGRDPLAQSGRALTDSVTYTGTTRSLRANAIDGPAPSFIEKIATFVMRLCNPHSPRQEIPLDDVLSFGSSKSLATADSLKLDPNVLPVTSPSFHSGPKKRAAHTQTQTLESHLERNVPLTLPSDKSPTTTLPVSVPESFVSTVHVPAPALVSESTKSNIHVLADASTVVESGHENVASNSVPTSSLTRLESISNHELPTVDSTSTLLDPRATHAAPESLSTSLESISKKSTTEALTLPASISEPHVATVASIPQEAGLTSALPNGGSKKYVDHSKLHAMPPTDTMIATVRSSVRKTSLTAPNDLSTALKDLPKALELKAMPPAAAREQTILDNLAKQEKSLPQAHLYLFLEDPQTWLPLYVRYSEQVYGQGGDYDLYGVKALLTTDSEDYLVNEITAGLQSQNEVEVATAERLLAGLVYKWELDGKSQNHVEALYARLIAKSRTRTLWNRIRSVIQKDISVDKAELARR